MKTITQFGGQNWLITPAARAVGEPQPTSIRDQKWLLTLTGVAIVDLIPNFNGDWLRETLQILPDMNGPLKFAINRFLIPTNPRYILKGISETTPLFQLEEWAPFASLGSIFDKNQAIDAGFAVDTWRPSPFLTLSTIGLPTISQIFQGIRVDVAVRDTDAVLHRVNYHISLLGKIVFARPEPCNQQINAVNVAENAADAAEKDANTPHFLPNGKPDILANKEADEAFEEAKEDLKVAQQALKVCLSRPHLEDIDKGGVLTQ